jgi:hypothetical protein
MELGIRKRIFLDYLTSVVEILRSFSVKMDSLS